MRRTKQAFITVEATLVLPVFIFVIYFFLYFYQILILQDVIHVNATEAAKEVSSYGIVANLLMKQTSEGKKEEFKELLVSNTDGFLSDAIGDVDVNALTGNVVDNLYFSYRLASSLGEQPNVKRCIEGGYDGISLYGSSIFDEEECITIILSYKIRFPIFQNVLPRLPVTQIVRMRSFNGHPAESKGQTADKEESVSEEDKEEELVYITKNGSVYHTNKSCIYINISVSSCPSSDIANKRNDSGAKYYACERCFQKGEALPSVVYFTKFGTRYHKNTSCTAIDRTILTVPISKVSNRKLCKRCQQYH